MVKSANVKLIFKPLIVFAPRVKSKAQMKLLKDEAVKEVLRAVNAWEYSR